MQALGDDARDAVKQAHPELDAEEVDRLLDQLDALRAERFFLDPEAEQDQDLIRTLDERRDKLIRQKLPRLEQALQKAHGQKQEDA